MDGKFSVDVREKKSLPNFESGCKSYDYFLQGPQNQNFKKACGSGLIDWIAADVWINELWMKQIQHIGL